MLIGVGGVLLYLKWTNLTEKSYWNSIVEIKRITRQFIANMVQKADTLNYILLTDSLRKEFIYGAIQEDSLKNVFEMWIPEYHLDSAHILGVSLLSSDSAEVFVRQFDFLHQNQDTNLVTYRFIKETEKWKIAGFSEVGRIVSVRVIPIL